MDNVKSANLINFYNSGLKRVVKLMQQRNFDHAFVIIDLLQKLPLSEYEKMRPNIKSYCDVYPEETWALKFVSANEKQATRHQDSNRKNRLK